MARWVAEHKGISFGTGVSLLTLLAGLFSDYLRKHWWVLVCLLVVGLALIIVPILHSFFSRKTQDSPHPATKTQVARDNSGKMILADTVNYHEAPNREQSPSPTPIVRQERPKPKLQAESMGTDWAKVDSSGT